MTDTNHHHASSNGSATPWTAETGAPSSPSKTVYIKTSDGALLRTTIAGQDAVELATLALVENFTPFPKTVANVSARTLKPPGTPGLHIDFSIHLEHLKEAIVVHTVEVFLNGAEVGGIVEGGALKCLGAFTDSKKYEKLEEDIIKDVKNACWPKYKQAETFDLQCPPNMSMLEQLPPELRDKIFGYVLIEPDRLTDSRLFSNMCHLKKRILKACQDQNMQDVVHTMNLKYGKDKKFAAARICHSLRGQALTVYFRNTHFVFDSTMQMWVFLTVFGPECCKHIQKLTFQLNSEYLWGWMNLYRIWDKGFAVLQQCKSLKTLQIAISGAGFFQRGKICHLEDSRGLRKLAPILQTLQPLQNFKIRQTRSPINMLGAPISKHFLASAFDRDVTGYPGYWFEPAKMKQVEDLFKAINQGNPQDSKDALAEFRLLYEKDSLTPRGSISRTAKSEGNAKRRDQECVDAQYIAAEESEMPHETLRKAKLASHVARYKKVVSEYAEINREYKKGQGVKRKRGVDYDYGLEGGPAGRRSRRWKLYGYT